MEVVRKQDIREEALPGRGLKRAVGKNSHFYSEKMTVGFAIYGEYGEMKPHRHAEETVYVVDCSEDTYVLFGDDETCSKGRERIYPGSVLHVDEMEWHNFEYVPGGFVELMFIYGQVDNLRPEDRE